MIDSNQRVALNEVSSFLNLIDKKYINKIPIELVNFFKVNNTKYNHIKYDISKPLYKQNISREALAIIGFLHLNYWCETEQEKQKLEKIFKNNWNKSESIKRKKYNPDSIFKKTKKEVNNNNLQLIEKPKVKFFEKIINKIKNLFFDKNKIA